MRWSPCPQGSHGNPITNFAPEPILGSCVEGKEETSDHPHGDASDFTVYQGQNLNHDKPQPVDAPHLLQMESSNNCQNHVAACLMYILYDTPLLLWLYSEGGPILGNSSRRYSTSLAGEGRHVLLTCASQHANSSHGQATVRNENCRHIY